MAEEIDPSIDAKIKNGFDKNNNFIDYFIEVGVSPDIILKESFLNAKNLDEVNKNITPMLITKFPKLDKKTISVDESIINHLFPRGFKAIHSKEQPASLSFNLVLDNQFYSAVYTNKFLSCKIIYESLYQYRIISNLYFNKSDNSNSQFEHEIYIPKCICFVSVFPFMDYFHRILNVLEIYVRSTFSDKEGFYLFNKLIERLLIEIPALPRGGTQFELKLIDTQIKLEQRKLNEMPLINFDIKSALDVFKVDKIIEIFKYLLYETKMIFFSENIVSLTNVIFSFVELLFPFKYQFQISSILPQSFYVFVENVAPFIFGLNEAFKPSFFKDNDISMKNLDIVVVDIDKGTVDLYSSSKKLNQDFPEIPKTYRKQLEDSLKKARKKSDSNTAEIQEIFLNFMISILELYPKYLQHDYVACHETNEVSSLINLSSYLSAVGSGEKEFYQKIFSTQMFIEFMFKRMMPKDSYDKLDLIFFEEKINEKMQKKKIFSKAKQSVFISARDYDFKTTLTISIDSPELSKYDKDFLSIEKNKKDALLNGIKCTQKTNQNGQPSFTFTYILFPSMLPESLFQQNIQHYVFPINYTEQLEEPNSRIVSLSNFAVNENHICDMENYIYLSWMIVWSLTFWYTDQREKKARFELLRKVMGKVYNHEMEIFELLFNTLQENGDEEMIIQLYKILIHRRLNPSWNIYNTVSKIINKKENNKKQIASILRMSSIRYNTNIITFDNQNNSDDEKFRQRTLKDKNDINILSEDVTFYAYDSCIDCQKNFNLYEQSKNLEKIPYDEFWIKCPNCKNNNNILLKLNFRFGCELFNSDITSDASSIKDEVILYSPKTLKERLMKVALSLEPGETFSVEDFKTDYKILFWNCVWYFKIVNADISLMLPYAESPKELKCDTNDIIFFTDIKEKADSQPPTPKDTKKDNKKLMSTNHNNLISEQINKQKQNQIKKISTLTNLLYSQKELINQPVSNFQVIPYIGVVASNTSKLAISNETKQNETSSLSLNEHNILFTNDDFKSTLKLNSINEDAELTSKNDMNDDPFKVDNDDLKIFGTLKEDFCNVGENGKGNLDFDSSDENESDSNDMNNDSYDN